MVSAAMPPLPPDSSMAVHSSTLPSPPSSAASSAASSVDGTTDDDDDDDSVSRPSIFPAGRHAPAPRAAPLEEYYGHGVDKLRHLELLSELKSTRLEGLYNLAFLVLTFALVYLSFRNIAEVGLVIGPAYVCPKQIARDFISCVVLGSLTTLFLSAVALTIVHLQIRHLLIPSIALLIHLFCNISALIFCSSVIVSSPINPIFGGLVSVVIVIVVLKTHSYVVTNQLLEEETQKKRQARRTKRPKPSPSASTLTSRHASAESLQAASVASSSRSSIPSVTHGPKSSNASSMTNSFIKKKKSIAYPNNVTFANYTYFLFAPTLVYETHYPSTTNIRPGYVLWYAIQTLLCWVLQYLLLLQFCVPVFRSAGSVEGVELVWFIMRLAIPVFTIFLLTFWGMFHCHLNTIAELMRFADRGFYQEWWNATTLSSFWRMWNVPVHEWCLRHVYVESVKRHHVRAKTAVVGTFVCSAILHEYVVATAFKVQPFSWSLPWMFLGMAVQVPLMALDKKIENTRRGNWLMWINLFLGQPLIAILYVRQYMAERDFLMCQT